MSLWLFTVPMAGTHRRQRAGEVVGLKAALGRVLGEWQGRDQPREKTVVPGTGEGEKNVVVMQQEWHDAQCSIIYGALTNR